MINESIDIGQVREWQKSIAHNTSEHQKFVVVQIIKDRD